MGLAFPQTIYQSFGITPKYTLNYYCWSIYCLPYSVVYLCMSGQLHFPALILTKLTKNQLIRPHYSHPTKTCLPGHPVTIILSLLLSLKVGCFSEWLRMMSCHSQFTSSPPSIDRRLECRFCLPPS